MNKIKNVSLNNNQSSLSSEFIGDICKVKIYL